MHNMTAYFSQNTFEELEKFGFIEVILIALKIDDPTLLPDVLDTISRSIEAGETFFKSKKDGVNPWLKEMKQAGIG